MHVLFGVHIDKEAQGPQGLNTLCQWIGSREHLNRNRLYVFLWNIRVIPVVYQQPMDIFWNPWIVCILTHFDIYIYIVHMCRSHEHMDFSIHRYFMLLNWKTPPNYSVRLLVVSENPTSITAWSDSDGARHMVLSENRIPLILVLNS